MKIALYIEDGLEQIVLTPTTASERSILNRLHDGTRQLAIRRGAFYECKGGWTRHGPVTSDMHGVPNEHIDESTMLVLWPE